MNVGKIGVSQYPIAYQKRKSVAQNNIAQRNVAFKGENANLGAAAGGCVGSVAAQGILGAAGAAATGGTAVAGAGAAGGIGIVGAGTTAAVAVPLAPVLLAAGGAIAVCAGVGWLIGKAFED